MMNKEFCTYGQSIALKELEFDENCMGRYGMNSKKLFLDAKFTFKNSSDLYSDIPNDWCNDFTAAPLKRQAFKFFREKCNMFGHIGIDNDGIWSFSVGEYMPYKYIPTDFIGFNTYEEAEEVCLDKLIEIAKNKYGK